MSELEKAKGILKQLQGKGYANDRSQESYKKRAKRIEKELNDLEKSSNKKKPKTTSHLQNYLEDSPL